MFEQAEIHFTCHDEIGSEGRNSKVFTATDHQLDAPIVVKRIDRQDFLNQDEYFAEAKRLYDARHPHVVPVKFACKTTTHIFIAMPLYERGSVHSLLLRRHPTVREIVRIGLDFLTGLHHIHLCGLIHFDVKPSNVLLDASGRAAVTDFGLAKYVDSHGLAERDVMYASHRPPEGFLYDVFAQAADIYQAGLTLYRMAVGLAAFDEQWASHAGDPTQAGKAVIAGRLPDRTASAYPAHIPSRLRKAIRTALQPDPDDRYGEVLGLINDLGNVDEWLDWQYDRAGALERWTSRYDGQQKVIELTEVSRTSYEVRAKSIRLEDGRERKSGVLSGDTITRALAHGLVQNALTNL
ncbi:MAG: serine/threonine-protein kinase [Longimicrobiales bacterium]